MIVKGIEVLPGQIWRFGKEEHRVLEVQRAFRPRALMQDLNNNKVDYYYMAPGASEPLWDFIKQISLCPFCQTNTLPEDDYICKDCLVTIA